MNTAAVILDAPVMCRFHVGSRETANYDLGDLKCCNPGANCVKLNYVLVFLDLNIAVSTCYYPPSGLSGQR